MHSCITKIVNPLTIKEAENEWISPDGARTGGSKAVRSSQLGKHTEAPGQPIGKRSPVQVPSRTNPKFEVKWNVIVSSTVNIKGGMLCIEKNHIYWHFVVIHNTYNTCQLNVNVIIYTFTLLSLSIIIIIISLSGGLGRTDSTNSYRIILCCCNANIHKHISVY